MKMVLLSGGSGKRLWPLSNDARPKQFLRLLADSEGGIESMVQRVWRQIGAAGLSADTFVAVGEKQTDIIRKQLGPEANLILEPSRRDTFPAVSLVAAYLHSIACVDPDEVVAVLPVDPYVEEHFFQAIQALPGVIRRTGAELALIGVEPTYPSSKYGYIIPREDENWPDEDSLPVASFKEKPTEEQAEHLLKLGALWNCGVFGFRLGYMIDLLRERGLPVEYEEMVRQYDLMPEISFDYEVVEKAGKIAVARYNGKWKDLGTWNTLTEEMGIRQVGQGIVCDQSVNTHIINELNTNVVVIGLSDIVVAASPDGILVTDKAASPRLKEIIKGIEPTSMSVERLWGSYRVVDKKQLDGGKQTLTKIAKMDAGQSLSYHLHLNREEVWTVVGGSGEFVLNNEFIQLAPGSVVRVPAGTLHSVRANTDLEWIEYQLGSVLDEDDYIQLFTEWDEIKHHCRIGSA